LATQRDETRAVVISIGRRLRSARQERGMTLQKVAKGSGLTAAFISQLERGDTSASLSSLVKIALALGIEVTSLFEKPSSTLVRRGDRVPTMLGGEGVMDYLLTPAAEKRAQVIETHLEPGGYADEGLYTRGGELLICIVQSGTLEMRLEDERITLHAGDALTIDPNVPRTWRNPSRRSRTKVIWVDVPAEY
jgi:quercetin dioxygenase-like cupin family protein/DNA-binding XRE family transcriptional regulator